MVSYSKLQSSMSLTSVRSVCGIFFISLLILYGREERHYGADYIARNIRMVDGGGTESVSLMQHLNRN